jgi:hypothetical protein
MAKGLLGKAMSVAGQNVEVYPAPGSIQFATVNVNIVNTDAAEATVRIAITTSVAPAAADYIDNGSKVPPLGGVLERMCIVLSPGEKVFVYSSNSNCAIQVRGLEQQ